MTSALVLNLGLGFAALAALCLSQDRHHREVFRSKPGRRRVIVLRLAGWVGIGFSLLLTGYVEGWDIGLVGWIGALTGAAVALVLLLSYRPRIVYPAGAGALVVGACAGLLLVLR